MSFPKVGDVVVLRHTVTHDKHGNPSITGSRSREETRVAAVYHDGRVRVVSGDVWDIVKLGDGRWGTGLK